jgi:hypothetical protein
MNTPSLSDVLCAPGSLLAPRGWPRSLVRGLGAFLLAAAATLNVSAQTVFRPSLNVGQTSVAIPVSVPITATGTVNTVNVLTLGVSGLDFATAAGTSTCANQFVTSGHTCTQYLAFTPAVPGIRLGAVELLDNNGNVLGTEYLMGIGLGSLGVMVPGTLQTVAGDGDWKEVLDGNPATLADLDQPSSVVLDGAGNIYIADSAHGRIREVSAATGIISTIAGDGGGVSQGDNGPATSATLLLPSGIAIDGAGNLYIAETGNNDVRKITASTGIITTVAGNGTVGYGGDYGPATDANLDQPEGVTMDTSGNFFIADTANHRIRRVDVATGIIITVAGDGATNPTGGGTYTGDGGPATLAGLNYPYAVWFDEPGNMYIPDSGNSVIRKVDTTGTITTFAGNGTRGYLGDGGAANLAELNSPSGVASDVAGNLYIADTQNAVIRKVSSQTGDISTVAGNGVGAYNGDGAAATSEGLYAPIGLYVDGGGSLYIADYFNMRVREDVANLGTLTYTTAVFQTKLSAPQSQAIENNGNAALDLTTIVFDTNAQADPDPADTTCSIAKSLALDASCVISAEFAPTTAGDPLTGNVAITANASDSPLNIQLVGDALPINATTITVENSPNPSSFGQSVTLSATVTTGSGTLFGDVQFMDGTTKLGPATPVQKSCSSTCTATFTTSTLAVGTHPITASYTGDSIHAPGTSTPPVNQVVYEATQTTLTSSDNPSLSGASVTFTATVTPAGASTPPTGTVTFDDGTTVLATVSLNASGVATFSTSSLSVGAHPITATYSGNTAASITGSTSAVVSQDVRALSAIAVTSNPNPSFYGVAVTFTATVTPSGSAAPTGAVSFFDGSTQIGLSSFVGTTGIATFTTSSLTVGPHIITASYPGDVNNTPGTSAAITQTVNQTQTATALAAVPNPVISGQATTITAIVTASKGTAVPTGPVSFTDGSVSLGSQPLNGAGTAAINPVLAPGTHSITATYAGDADDAGSSSSVYLVVVQLATTSVAVTATPNPSTVLSAVTVSAKVTGNGGTPTGSVNFVANGTIALGSAKLDGTGKATVTITTLAAGTYQITAVYSGDSNDTGSTSSAITEVVDVIPTTTNLNTAMTTGANPQVILVASIENNDAAGPSPTGTVTFTSGTSTIGTAILNAGGVATLTPSLGVGTFTIVASYPGDSLHGPSTSSSVTVIGTGTGSTSSYTLTVSPATVSMATTQNATVTVTLTSISGFADTINLGCSGLPHGANCNFSNAAMPLGANATVTAQLTIDTNNPLGGGSSAMNTQQAKRGVKQGGLFIPFSIVMGWIVWRFRNRNASVWTTALFILLSGAAMLATSCGGFTQSSVAQGTYTIQVFGVGVASNVSEYQDINLTITQ